MELQLKIDWLINNTDGDSRNMRKTNTMTNNTIDQVATYLRQHKYTSSDFDFSQAWLSKSCRYYGMLKSSGRDISPAAAIQLSLKLKERGDITMRHQPDIGTKMLQFSRQVLNEVIPLEALR